MTIIDGAPIEQREKRTITIEVPDTVDIMQRVRVIELVEGDQPGNCVTITWAGEADKWVGPDLDRRNVVNAHRTYESCIAAQAAACALINLRSRERIATNAALEAVREHR